MANPDDSLPTWTISLTGAVQRAHVLSDLGIFPLQRWRLTARCPWHGPQSLTLETTELLGEDVLSGYLKCEPCFANDLTKWLSVNESRLLRDGEK